MRKITLKTTDETQTDSLPITLLTKSSVTSYKFACFDKHKKETFQWEGNILISTSSRRARPRNMRQSILEAVIFHLLRAQAGRDISSEDALHVQRLLQLV